MTSTDPIILAVDDNADSLTLLNDTLSDQGYTVLVANSGQAALDILNKAQPDLILLDAMMPAMDGFITCQNIKNSHPDIPVVFMTGLEDTEHVVKGLSVGAVDYLTKPLNYQELIARVKVHINNAQMTHNTKAAMDSVGQHMAAISGHGQLLWTTATAQNFIEKLNSKERLHLKEWLLRAAEDDTLALQGGQLVITFLSKQEPDAYLIRIKTQDLKLLTQTLKLKLKITRREADVLYWVAKGKTDWEIAQILSISERTVNKHLEQVFRKLQVNNRTAATALVMQAIH